MSDQTLRGADRSFAGTYEERLEDLVRRRRLGIECGCLIGGKYCCPRCNGIPLEGRIRLAAYAGSELARSMVDLPIPPRNPSCDRCQGTGSCLPCTCHCGNPPCGGCVTPFEEQREEYKDECPACRPRYVPRMEIPTDNFYWLLGLPKFGFYPLLRAMRSLADHGIRAFACNACREAENTPIVCLDCRGRTNHDTVRKLLQAVSGYLECPCQPHATELERVWDENITGGPRWGADVPRWLWLLCDLAVNYEPGWRLELDLNIPGRNRTLRTVLDSFLVSLEATTKTNAAWLPVKPAIRGWALESLGIGDGGE